MYALKEIVFDDKRQFVSIFYASLTGKVEKQENKPFPVIDKAEEKQQHCEIFKIELINRYVLNEDSFTLHYGKDRSIKFYITAKQQINHIAGLVEHTTGGGLKILEHFGKMKHIKLEEIKT